MTSRLPPELLEILAKTPGLERSYLVGGCVRDWLLGVENKDFDVEVFDVNYEDLAKALSRWGRIDLVGRSFGVVKLTVPEHTFDFTVPRRDSKIAAGHKGFQITFEPGLELHEAAARRDFTINSLLYDPRQDKVLDFYGGQDDLKNRVLRHTSPAFSEDPLRVLRGMQFAARFDLTAAQETIHICRQMKSSHGELAVERIREEWFKWAEKSVTPSRGLRFLEETEWLDNYPELAAMRGTPQDPEWHPEGDVFTHTCHCCDALARLPEFKKADPESKITYMLAVLTHDTGKAYTTRVEERQGKMRTVSPGHEVVSGELAEQFLTRINAPVQIRQRVAPLVVNHMAHIHEVSDKMVRRLAKRLEPENIEGLAIVMSADQMGRPPRPPIISEGVHELRKKAWELQVHDSAPKPILLGRHLIELGIPPGKSIGQIVQAAYEAQLSGHFFDLPAAYQWLLAEPNLPISAEALETLRIKIASNQLR